MPFLGTITLFVNDRGQLQEPRKTVILARKLTAHGCWRSPTVGEFGGLFGGLSGDERYAFPKLGSPLKPMRENAINGALRRMG